MKQKTKLLHANTYCPSKTKYGALNPPVIHASTVIHKDYDELMNPPKEKIVYGRYGLEPMHTFKKTISELEGAHDTIVTSCGQQAVSVALLGVLKAGDHILLDDGVFPPTKTFVEGFLSEFGIEYSFFNSLTLDNIENLKKDNTKVVMFETPSSITMEMPNITAIIKFAKKHNLISVVDSTFGSGYLFKPLNIGVDISIMAATKYIVGHSDALIGTIAIKTQQLFEVVYDKVRKIGISVAPDDIALALRGIRTLDVRLKQHNINAGKMIEFLASHPLVDEVLSPAYKNAKGHKYWQEHFSANCGLMSFTFKENYDDKQMAKFANNLKLFSMGYSWGGYESLICFKFPDRSIAKWIGNMVVRIHVGLEDIDDLICDLKDSMALLK